MYTNTLINITKKRQSKSVINNTEYHDTRGNGFAQAGGSQIDEYRIYNTEIVPTVQGFNRYIKKHGHVGYKSADEIVDRKNDFVIPRMAKDTCLMDTMIISPGFRIKASAESIEEFMESENMQFFYDYVNEFMKNDPKLKDCKVLSAIVHFDEVHFPRSEYDDEGKWVRDYSDEESMELAYIPIHMHINYLPLTKEVDKEGKEYLKLTHKEIWKSEKGRYWQSYKEFNDRQYNAIGKKYGLSRGNVWEDWKTRIQDAENGKKAKKKRDLTDFIMDREQARVDGIKRQQSELQEEVRVLELDVKDYQARINRLKAQLVEEENRQNELARKTAKMKEAYIKEISAYNNACYNLTEAYKELEVDERKLRERQEYVKMMYKELDEKARYLVNIEMSLSNNEITMDEAEAIARQLSLDEKIAVFKRESAKDTTPYLYELANRMDEER